MMMEGFGTYNNWGRDMGGLSVDNPELYRWYYRELKVDEKPLFGNKQRKENTQVGLEELDGTVEMENELDLFELKDALRKVLLKLTPREERIVREVIFNQKTFNEIGQDMRVSGGRIGQIFAKALWKMQKPKIKELLEDFA
jgi:RNA polymerase sigma factor (sigma-70 family)